LWRSSGTLGKCSVYGTLRTLNYDVNKAKPIFTLIQNQSRAAKYRPTPRLPVLGTTELNASIESKDRNIHSTLNFRTNGTNVVLDDAGTKDWT
jgi:hypothetical protein